MKATGIVRRIDDLGRVVIPREIRKAMKIQNGEPLELFIEPETNSVIFKRLNQTRTIKSDIGQLFEVYGKDRVLDLIKELYLDIE